MACLILTIFHPGFRRNLTSAEKTNFIDAVNCLHAKPAINTAYAPGAVSRYDDFQAEHMRQTPDIHFTVRLSQPEDALLLAMILGSQGANPIGPFFTVASTVSGVV